MEEQLHKTMLVIARAEYIEVICQEIRRKTKYHGKIFKKGSRQN